MTEEDVYFSFLPLAHIFDRLIEEYSVRSGAAIGFWQGVSYCFLIWFLVVTSVWFSVLFLVLKFDVFFKRM